MVSIKDIASHNKPLEMVHPGTGEPIGLTVELLAPDNPVIKTLLRRLTDMRKHKAQRNQIATAVDDERASMEVCAAAVVDWTWTKDKEGEYIGDWEGEQPDFNRKTLSEMLALDWFREQIDRDLSDQKSFF